MGVGVRWVRSSSRWASELTGHGNERDSRLGWAGGAHRSGRHCDGGRRSVVDPRWPGPNLKEPARERVVITGIPTVPFLRPLLITAGDRRDRQLERLGRSGFRAEPPGLRADAVIDLLGCVSHRLFNRVQPVIISPGPRMDGWLSVPGLLMAILRCSTRRVDIEVFIPVHADPGRTHTTHRLLPEPDSGLAENVASAAAAVLRGTSARVLLDHRHRTAPI